MNNQQDNIQILPHKKIILLVNLGSPDLLTVGAIRKFLGKFLSDKRVVNLPKIIWYPILYGIILLLRPAKLLVQYKHIWYKDNSPLVYYTKFQAQKLKELINDDQVVVKYAFSYSTPQVSDVLAQIHSNFTVDKLTVIPLYPQFSSTTTMAVFDNVSKFYQDKFYLPQVCYINSFYNNKLYIKALAQSILASWATNSRHEKLVFSYHGLPVRIIQNGDAYFEQCLVTTKLVATELQLNEDEYVVAFQSKFGSEQWLSPSTVSVLNEYAQSGVKSVDIICPGFVSECLETLEEIAITLKSVYIKAGGETYNYIPCLNADNGLVQVLQNLSSNL